MNGTGLSSPDIYSTLRVLLMPGRHAYGDQIWAWAVYDPRRPENQRWLMSGAWYSTWDQARRKGLAERAEYASGRRRHEYTQHRDANVRVCYCGLWPDHHVHTGDRSVCGCDACRSVPRRSV
ncbi:hypothetical protein [Actinomadura sp. 21ATH]|uniref:hypothetical protein n=1 Tax=Actinomadura sp. 21ATH TaxID=1735444 RepID=UPI0035BF379D